MWVWTAGRGLSTGRSRSGTSAEQVGAPVVEHARRLRSGQEGVLLVEEVEVAGLDRRELGFLVAAQRLVDGEELLDEGEGGDGVGDDVVDGLHDDPAVRAPLEEPEADQRVLGEVVGLAVLLDDRRVDGLPVLALDVEEGEVRRGVLGDPLHGLPVHQEEVGAECGVPGDEAGGRPRTSGPVRA